MKMRFCLLTLVLSLSQTALAQTTNDIRQLVLGQPVEREITGDATHTYQVQLEAGRFLRFRLDQRTIDATLILNTRDGKKSVEMDLTGAGEEEQLSLEVTLAGIYQLLVRGNGPPALRGTYRLEANVQATVTARDRKHLTAQAVLLKAQDLDKGAADTKQQVIEKLGQALPIWLDLDAPNWSALTLNKIGKMHVSLKQYDQAIANFEQALTIHRNLKNRFGEARVLNNLANAFLNQRQFDKAVESFEKSLAVYRELKDRRWEGITLLGLGNTRSNLNQLEKAIEYYQQALTIFARSEGPVL